MITHIIILSFYTIGFCCTFWEGMIFEKVGDMLEDHLPEIINKPLWSCFVCACFWHGTLIYWAYWHVSLVDWILTVIPAMGVNAFISRIIARSEDEK